MPQLHFMYMDQWVAAQNVPGIPEESAFKTVVSAVLHETSLMPYHHGPVAGRLGML